VRYFIYFFSLNDVFDFKIVRMVPISLMYHVYSKNKIETNYKLLPFKTMHLLNIHNNYMPFQKSTSISPTVDSYLPVYTLLLYEFQQTLNVILNSDIKDLKFPIHTRASIGVVMMAFKYT